MRYLLPLLLLCGCAETGQERIEVPLRLAGTALDGPVTSAGGTITVERAELAFGPLYLCAGTTAGELCETARLEWLDTVVVDLLDDSPIDVGELTGVSGSVRSWMYDLGISSQLTQDDPFVLDAAQALDGASIHVVGVAEVEGVQHAFDMQLPIAQTDDTELGVPVVRKSNSETFVRDVVAGDQLTIRFDVAAWLARIDFRQTCAAADCTDGLNLQADSQPYRAMRNALLSGVRPQFTWETR
jgi:hypothetical protein